MKLKDVFCAVLVATAGVAPTQAQTANATLPTKTPATSIHKPHPPQLSFTDARSMTVTVMTGSPLAPQDLGSGVWLGKNGYVATCQHVIASTPGPYAIGLPNNLYISEDGSVVIAGAANRFPAQLVAEDADTDVAILKAVTPMDQIRVGPLTPPSAPRSITPQDPVIPKSAILKSNLPNIGETLFAAGFPPGRKNADTSHRSGH